MDTNNATIICKNFPVYGIITKRVKQYLASSFDQLQTLMLVLLLRIHILLVEYTPSCKTYQ